MGCGGFGPGDYQLYRIAASEASLSESCGADSDDTNTVRDGSTVMLFFSGGETESVFLDLGESVLEGIETEEGYDFDGTVVDIEEQGDATLTTRTDIKVNLVFDDDTVNLKTTTTIALTCSGECTGFDPFSCTATGTAVGVEIDESVSVPVGDGNP
jgi:hypothetical protein